ncbi:putative prolyl 4-hydroxylase 7 isoform X2 [Tasmannia lanceolata]|uniref:putative prolyl 4-hydroxylase 7 isoform X2 n=1 Tax=Tasmannia lanceolata TaxID=3420 RepID=UPI004062C10B
MPMASLISISLLLAFSFSLVRASSRRAFLYKGFLTNEECDHLVSLSNGMLKKSLVLDSDSGKGVASHDRSSSGMFLDMDQDEVVARIEDRISAWTFLPKENGEPLRILHYGLREGYEPHYDYYNDKSKLVFGGHRIASILMYLSNVTRGGETMFPNSELKDIQAKDSSWYRCAMMGYSVKPIKGNALLFFSLHPNATTDESSLHSSCPVVEGEKWTATKWIHVKAFSLANHSSSSDGECTDEDGNCSQWAAIGECQKNPVFMMGTPDYYGTCRKSCRVC